MFFQNVAITAQAGYGATNIDTTSGAFGGAVNFIALFALLAVFVVTMINLFRASRKGEMSWRTIRKEIAGLLILGFFLTVFRDVGLLWILTDSWGYIITTTIKWFGSIFPG